jgi:HEAT repeat protein
MRSPPATRTFSLGLLVAGVVAGGGCAGWRARFDAKQVALDRERYGATADQRIKEFTTEAERSKKAAAASQQEFTDGLVNKLLDEHDPRVRVAMLDAAARFDTPSAVAICKGALEDPDERVRAKACEVWGQRGGPEAVSLLAARFDTDDDIDVRLKALRELGRLGDEAAIPVLARALENTDPAVQFRAVAALKQVSGRDLGDDVNLWRAWAADSKAPGTEWTIAEGFRRLF